MLQFIGATPHGVSKLSFGKMIHFHPILVPGFLPGMEIYYENVVKVESYYHIKKTKL